MNEILNKIWKPTAAYIVGSIGFIQLASVVLDNISSETLIGTSSEYIMQIAFMIALMGLPIVIIFSYFFAKKNGQTRKLPANIKLTASGDYKPRIAVVPFANLNKDHDGGFLVDGIVEDVITEFSMVREIEILSRQTCFNFRDRNITYDKFRTDHGLDYIVSGSIRALNARLRISVELAETMDGNVVWSNKYDREKKDIFDIQDEIVRKITTSLIGEIEISSLKRAHRKPTENMTSYEFLLKGKNNHHKFTKLANAEARKDLDAAIEADKNNSQAYAWKACAIGQALGRGYLEMTDEVVTEVRQLLDTALEVDQNDFECHRMLCEVNLSMHQFEQGLESGRKAFKMNPNDPRVISVYGEILLRVGELDLGIQHLEKAYQLEPVPSGQTTGDKRLAALFLGYYLKNDFEKCEQIIQDIINLDNRTWLLYIDLHIKYSKDYKNLNWYKKNIDNFSELNWSLEIDRYHLNDQSLEQHLLKLTQAL